MKSLSELLPFLHTGVHISDVHKTGLGSSAALITSLVSALLLHLELVPSDSFDLARNVHDNAHDEKKDDDDDDDNNNNNNNNDYDKKRKRDTDRSGLGGSESASPGKRLAHNLAQYVHCLAQGKVGSGFDVSAAAFGSQLYTRFDPSVIQPLMNDDTVRYSSLPFPRSVGFYVRIEFDVYERSTFGFEFSMELSCFTIPVTSPCSTHVGGCRCGE